ncbi:hypothetical protein ACWGA0_11860 [Streptomyces erythrochromogenes]
MTATTVSPVFLDSPVLGKELRQDGGMRIWTLAGGMLLVIAWTAGYLIFEHDAWAFGLPIAGSVTLLILLDNVFHAGRRLSHQWRRRRSAPRRAAWMPDTSVRRPITYPGVLQTPAYADAVQAQGRFRATGVRIAVLPLLAIALLTVQAVFLKDGGPLALGFVLAECLLLLTLVWTLWSRSNPSLTWVTRRLRQEWFRREMFLLLTGTGPYLGLRGTAAEAVRDQRLALLDQADPAGLLDFTELGTPDIATGTVLDWQDEVWRAGPVAGDAALTELMRTYLDHRVRRQRLFMELAAEKADRSEGTLGGTVKGLVLTGVAAALAYATLLFSGLDLSGTSALTATVALLTACMPPLCNSALAIQNLYGFQRLGRSHTETRRELLIHENTLTALIAEPPAADTATRFRALAVRVETTLTEDVRRWRLLVNRPEFDAGL